MKHYSPTGRKESWQTFEETSGYVKTGTGQKVAQLHDRYMMMMMMVVIKLVVMMMIMMTYVVIHVKYQLLLLEFNESRISSTDFRKTFKNQIS
jgi:hypothetical protein